MNADLHIVHADRTYAVAHFRSLHITHYRTGISIESVGFATDDFERHVAHHRGHPIATVMIAEPNLPLPEGEMRKFANDCMTRVSRHTGDQASVILGDGFWLSAARSVMTAMNMMSREKRNMRVFAGVPEAASWASAILGAPHESKLFHEVLSAVRETARS